MSLIATWDHHYYLGTQALGFSGDGPIWYWAVTSHSLGLYKENVPGGIAELELDSDPGSISDLVVTGLNKSNVGLIQYQRSKILLRRRTQDLCKISGTYKKLSGEPYIGAQVMFEDMEGIEVGNIVCNDKGEWYFFLQKNAKAFIRFENRPSRLWIQVPDEDEVQFSDLENNVGYWVPHNPV